MVLFYEYLTIWDAFLLLLHVVFVRRGNKEDRVKGFYWIEASIAARRLAGLLMGILGIPAEELVFQLARIRNQLGELIRVQIPRNDLYSFWNLIDQNKALSSGCLTKGGGARFQFFLRKELLNGNLIEQNSVPRALYLIHVVSQSEVIPGCAARVLVLQERPWQKEYAQYAGTLGVKLEWAGRRRSFEGSRRFVLNILYTIPGLYNLLQRLRGVGASKFDHSFPDYIFVQGRGDARLVNDGNNSDFDWVMQSGFPRARVVYLCPDAPCDRSLTDSGIHTVGWKDTQAYIRSGDPDRHYIKDMPVGLSGREKRELRRLNRDYRLLHGIWSGFFEQYGIKVFMTWYKYDGQHAVMADAIQALGGISAINQVAFDGYRNYECQISADLAFGFSGWSAGIEQELMSEIPYFVIAGYPRDHAKPLLEAEARKLRDELERAGAKKIIFTIDENSLGDARWHIGHGFQQENYRYVLEKVLELPWLGAIFKPKAPHTLRKRLGEVNELLCAAERTGRCVVLENRHYVTTVEPVLLAGLASDVCIHGHLSAGTAALECALAGLPTLLVDREHVPFSKLHELPRGTVVFEEWPSTIEAVMEHFTSESGVPGFGDWRGLLDELDPFRDGKASYRIGTYLKWLLEGFDHGVHRERILAEAASRYMEKWGADKVVSIGAHRLASTNFRIQ